MIEYGRVVGRFLTTTTDSSADTDQAPELTPVSGTITFKPNAQMIKATIDGGVTSLFPQSVTVSLNANGEIEHEGQLGIQLIATNTPDNNPVDWTYTVSCGFQINGKSVNQPAFSIPVYANGEMNLGSLAPVSMSNGVAVTKGDDGVGVSNIESSGDNIVFSMSDGSSHIVPMPIAEDGVGVASVEQTGPATIVFNYTDGTTSVAITLPAGPEGPAGTDGKSAYELAVEGGYTGSLSDWLASLEGPAGQDGLDGQNGADGLSAYEVWLGQGNTGTEADFLASLEGPEGPAGADGVDGTSAKIGLLSTVTNDPGTSANVTHILSGGTDYFKFYIPRGDKGEKGDPGVAADIAPNGLSTQSVYNTSIARGLMNHESGAPLPAKNMVDLGDFKVQFRMPSNGSYSTPMVLAIEWQGHGGASYDPDPEHQPVLDELGILYARGDYDDDAYGSPTVQEKIRRVYKEAVRLYPINGVVIMGGSMGGIAALNTLTNGHIPNILGLYLTKPTYDLRQRYDNGRKADIDAGYGIAADGSNYAEKTAGYDPALRPAADFKKVPMAITASYGDTLVLRTLHTDKLVSKLSATNNIQVLTASGDHSSRSHYNTNFFRTNMKRFIGEVGTPADDLLFDFDADSIVGVNGATMVQWNPKAGSRTSGVVPTSTGAPTLRNPDDTLEDGISEKSVSFTRATGAGMETPLYNNPIRGGMTVFCIVRDSRPAGTACRYLSFLGSNGWYVNFGSDANGLTEIWAGSNGSFKGPASTGSDWAVYGICIAGRNSWIGKNKVCSYGDINMLDANIDRIRFGIGHDLSTNNNLNGRHARVIGYNRALTPSEAVVMFERIAEEYQITF